MMCYTTIQRCHQSHWKTFVPTLLLSLMISYWFFGSLMQRCFASFSLNVPLLPRCVALFRKVVSLLSISSSTGGEILKSSFIVIAGPVCSSLFPSFILPSFPIQMIRTLEKLQRGVSFYFYFLNCSMVLAPGDRRSQR
mmetsp:Transcript_6137/g.9674  ORF Transcript_6137/g.9674 Transcript_6137/m.9674 type:complete len:138 (+) Transcript_6137:100-513(+)